MRQAIKSSKDTIQRTLIRAGVALLYAHWEGFIKRTAELYLDYVSSVNLTYNDIHPCFLAYSLKQKIGQFTETHSSKYKLHVDVVQTIQAEWNSKAKLPSGTIDTASNLSSAVFQEIAAIVAIDISKYETKFHQIDSSLVKRRNSIAHGEYLDIGNRDFEELSDDIIQLMRQFKDDIQNAIVLESYKKS